MGIMSSEWRGRLQHWMRTLKDDFYRPLGEISWEAFRTMDHLSQEEAMNGPFEPVEPGFTWGKTWEYCWFRGKVVLPAEAQGKRIVMDLKPDGESTLFVNGQEFGTYRASWVTQKHHFVEDNVLTTDAVAGTEYEILMETYAGHYYPESPDLSLIHISEPTRLGMISYAVFCLKKKKHTYPRQINRTLSRMPYST